MEHAGIGLEYFRICSNFPLSSCGLCRCPNSLEPRLWHWGGQVGPRWEDGAQGVKALGNAAEREMEMERETVLRIFVKTESCFWIVIVIKSRKSFYQIGSLGSGPWLYDAPQFSAVSSDRDHLCYRIFSNVSVIYKLFMFKFSTKFPQGVSRFFPNVPCPPETMLPLGVELQTFDEKSRLSRPEIFESKNIRPTLQTSPQSMHESIHDIEWLHI